MAIFTRFFISGGFVNMATNAVVKNLIYKELFMTFVPAMMFLISSGVLFVSFVLPLRWKRTMANNAVRAVAVTCFCMSMLIDGVPTSTGLSTTQLWIVTSLMCAMVGLVVAWTFRWKEPRKINTDNDVLADVINAGLMAAADVAEHQSRKTGSAKARFWGVFLKNLFGPKRETEDPADWWKKGKSPGDDSYGGRFSPHNN